MLTTTFNRARAANPCGIEAGSDGGFDAAANLLGGLEQYGANTPINLLTALDLAGLVVGVWCLSATVENSDKIARLVAADFAASVLEIYEAACPVDTSVRNAIATAYLYANESTNAEALRKALDIARIAQDRAVADGKHSAGCAARAAMNACQPNIQRGVELTLACTLDAAALAAGVDDAYPCHKTKAEKVKELTAIYRAYLL